MVQILVAIITAAATLIGVLAQTRTTYNKMMAELEKTQAVLETKLENLTQEVKTHNDFARRMPVVEEKVKNVEEDIKDLKNDGR